MTQASYVVVLSTDSVPPSAPTQLAGAYLQKQKQVQLTWKASTDNVGVVNYEVLRNGVVVGRPSSTGSIDAALAPGAVYNYAVLARDAAGNASVLSNSVGLTIPASGGTKKR